MFFDIIVFSKIKPDFYLLLLINLLSEAAPLSESSPSTGRLAQHNIARSAKDNCLCVAKNSGNLKASRTLDIHEETIGALHKTLELVCAGFLLGGGIQEIDRHFKIIMKIDSSLLRNGE